jgi:integrase
VRRTKTKLTRTKIGDRTFYCVTWPRIGKGRNRQHFKSKSEADGFYQAKLVEERNDGANVLAFTGAQRAEYLECCKLLEPVGSSLRDAVLFYLPHAQAAKRSVTVADAASEILRIKKAAGMSARHVANMRSLLGQFSETFGKTLMAELTVKDVDEWLLELVHSETGKPVSPTTRNNFRRVLVNFFNFAVNRGYCLLNAASKSAKAKTIEQPVGILTVSELKRLLSHAKAELIAYLVIGAFAGLRRSELVSLDWKEVDLDAGLIHVTAAKAKSARRRFVTIQPNLLAWLQEHQQSEGKVTPSNFEDLLKAARLAAGIHDWPHNALRHSYASYYLAHLGGTEKLAQELGHSGTDIVIRHYREVVKPAHGAAYWKIVPSPVSNVVQFANAAA